jgi:hypothetical protein
VLAMPDEARRYKTERGVFPFMPKTGVKSMPPTRTVSLDTVDAFNVAVDKLHALRMAVSGANSLDEDEAHALHVLSANVLDDFERLRVALGGDEAPLPEAA